MKIHYFVYFRSDDITPVISSDELPSFQMRSKPKYVGKRAKIEAIFRLSKVRLSSSATTQTINDYIAENFFNKPQWSEYHEIFTLVSSEKEVVSEKYEKKYTLIVEFDNSITVNNFKDERLIHLLTCELMGQPLDNYKELKNPIISLKKNY